MVILVAVVVHSPAARKSAPEVYLGITAAQDTEARRALQLIYQGHRREALRALAALTRKEAQDNLPPLSRMIALSGYAYWIHNGSYIERRQLEGYYREVRSISGAAMEIINARLAREPGNATYLFLKGGIIGFLGTLEVSDNPLRAIREGYRAVQILEEVLRLAPSMTDAHIALGIFNCAVANAPALIKTAIRLTGHQADLTKGLNHLRASAYDGHYTNVLAQLFLVRYLSPYVDELVREKRNIFLSMQRSFPSNPFFTFMHNEENLAFHSKVFFTRENKKQLEEKIESFITEETADKRYTNLIKWQYSLFDDEKPLTALLPDPGMNSGMYKYYPLYVDGLRLKRSSLVRKRKEGRFPRWERERIEEIRDRCFEMLDDSDMDTFKRQFFEWHVKDGLRIPE